MSLEINYYGSFQWGDGYGTSNMHWAKYLERAGVKIYPFFTFDSRERYWIEGDPEETAILNRPFEKKKIGVIETPPEFFASNVSDIKIGSTMAETTEIDKYWVEQCNQMDYIVLPSKFQKEVFSKCGVRVPIKIIPFGTEFEYFKPKVRPKRDVFTFGSLGFFMPTRDENDRKGFWKLIQAFISEFEPDEPVRLLLKSSSDESRFFVNWKDPRIEVRTDVVSREKLADVYYEMDCFVLPTRGEGVGQPPREAMSTGLPVIMTNWSSLADICKEEICYPLNDYKLVKRTGFDRQPGLWADVNVRELMYKMRYVYEHQAEARQKGKKASKWIRKHFSWNSSAKKMKEFLEELNEKVR